MSDFKDVAHRTVVELFDLAKEQQAEIKQLKAQLNNMESCYIQKKKECDGLQGRINKAMVACHESGVLGVFLAIKVEDALRGESK